jgi:hypothetical protein
MKKWVSTIRPFTISAAVALLFSLTVAAQEPRPIPGQGPGQNMPEVPPPPPLTKANTPKPKPAQKATLALFDKYEVVGMSAGEGNKDLDDFILALIRDPELPNKVNDIVVEDGNSLYQPILDRYIAGEDVPLTEVQQVWRNTTQPMGGLSTFGEELFPLIREINKKLPPDKKFRVLAADSPIDWSQAKSRDDAVKYLRARDESMASVMKTEVLSKHRKALALLGLGHLAHDTSSAVGRYEKDYPGVTYVVEESGEFGLMNPSARKYNDELEQRLASWPVPSLANVKGTWLDELPAAYTPLLSQLSRGRTLSSIADGYLYLGPHHLALYEHTPANIVLDKDYMAEKQRRIQLLGMPEHTGGMLGLEESNPTLLDAARDFIFGRGPPGGPGGRPGGPSTPPPR